MVHSNQMQRANSLQRFGTLFKNWLLKLKYPKLQNYFLLILHLMLFHLPIIGCSSQSRHFLFLGTSFSWGLVIILANPFFDDLLLEDSVRTCSNGSQNIKNQFCFTLNLMHLHLPIIGSFSQSKHSLFLGTSFSLGLLIIPANPVFDDLFLEDL